MRDHTAETAFRHWFAASARKIRSFERDEMALKVEGIVDARRPVEKGSNLPDPRGREGPESAQPGRPDSCRQRTGFHPSGPRRGNQASNFIH